MYNTIVMDHFLNPRNTGELGDADGVGVEGIPGEGNYMVLAIRVAEGLIQEARFQTYGCPAAIAAGSCLTEWITGTRVVEAEGLIAAELSERLGGLPLGKEHCAELAVRALHKALRAAKRRAGEQAGNG